MKSYLRPLVYVLLAIWALLSLFPLIWMFYTSFIHPDKIHAGGLALATSFDDFSMENYRVLWRHAKVGLWFANSLIVCLVVTAAHLFFDSLAGYAFAKKEFRGKNFLFWLIIATMMVPGQVIVVPMFILMSQMGLLDSLFAVILPGLAGPFGIFLMRQFIQGIPSDLEDAARIDGCTEFEIYWRIILPLCKPVMATLGIFVFVTHWNAFLWPLIVLFSSRNHTLSVGLATLQGKHDVDYGLLMSGAGVAALPMLIVFLLFSRFFVKGLQSGALKG